MGWQPGSTKAWNERHIIVNDRKGIDMLKINWVQAGITSLFLGLVDQVYGNTVLIEYEQNGQLMHIAVELGSAPCRPHEGQQVSFDSKGIVSCTKSSIQLN